MKLAFSTNAYVRYTLSEALQDIAATGYSAVEVLADTPHMYPDADVVSDGQLDQLAAQLSRLNLAVSNVNANCCFGYWRDAPPEPFFEPSLINPNRTMRTDRVRMICRAIEAAARIGSRCVSITSGKALPTVPPAKARELLRENLKPILQAAEAHGINVGIECEPGLLIEWTDELIELIEQTASNRLGANLDVGHCRVAGEDITETIRKLRGRIWNVHIADIAGRKHWHLIPGLGQMDFPAIRDALAEVGYDGFVTVELYSYPHMPSEAARRALAALKPIFEAS